MPVTVRQAGREDLPAIIAIEEASFSVPWSHQSLAAELDNPVAKYYVLEGETGQVLGYADVWLIADEGQLANIAIHPSARGHGYGETLLRTAMEALFQKASKLPRVDIVRPEKAIGTNTVMSMQSGAVRGYAGAIQGIVREMMEEIGGTCRVVATGGMGRMMAEYCDTITDVDANLTLTGLRMIYEANRDKFDAVEPIGPLVVSAEEEVNEHL